MTHRLGRVRYESAAFLGHHGEIDLVTGPAMTMSPREAVEWVWARCWNLDLFGAIRRWTVAGRQAFAFDGTNAGRFELTLVGSNPPELQIDRGQSFRMAAIAVGGKTVVIILRAPRGRLAAFLPVASRLLASLTFAPA